MLFLNVLNCLYTQMIHSRQKTKLSEKNHRRINVLHMLKYTEGMDSCNRTGARKKSRFELKNYESFFSLRCSNAKSSAPEHRWDKTFFHSVFGRIVCIYIQRFMVVDLQLFSLMLSCKHTGILHFSREKKRKKGRIPISMSCW